MNLFAKQLNDRTRNLIRILLIIFLAIIIIYIVFMTGGTKRAWSQLNFVVIVLAAYYWKIKGGLLSALATGIAVGPFMYLDVAQGILQTPTNWIIRLTLYMIMGLIVGYLFQENNKINKEIREKDLINNFTGLYNTNKLFLELNKMMKNDEKFYLVFFNILNLEEISKYVNYSIMKDIVNSYIASIKSEFEENELYSNNINQYSLVLKDCDGDDISQIIAKRLENILKLIKAEEYSYNLIIKAGIVFSNGEIAEETELFNMASIAADQGEKFESGVYTYGSEFYNERKSILEISSSFQKAINNNEFYLVYQPIISLNDNAIDSVEVLVRWNRGDRKPIGPDIFIKIAEETGFIKKLTREIVKQHMNQLHKWKMKGIEIKSSVNLTADEIIDYDLGLWIKAIVEENNIYKPNLGVEITERVFSRDINKLNAVLSLLQSKGYYISIDDFGTGYNNLFNLKEIKADIIKIDRCFINRMDEKITKSLVRHCIEIGHEMGLLVVAEGVETKEQLITLKELGCDMIQGYYFSKPLLPDDCIDYYKSFDMNKYI